MKRRTFLYSLLAAIGGAACGTKQIEELTARSPRYDVVLTLDETIQRIAEKMIVEPLVTEIKAGRLPEDTDAGFVCLSNKTGDAMALVPSAQTGSGFDNTRFAQRYVASTFKIFVYLVALEIGAISPDETFRDEPMSFRSLDGSGEYYKVSNYNDDYSSGQLSVEEAFARSSNVIAQQIYHRVDQEVWRKYLTALALPLNYDPNFLPLGRIIIPPLVLASRATVIARNGSFVLPRLVDTIQNGNNPPQAEPVETSPQIFRPEVCRIVSRAMRRCVEGGTASKASALANRVRAKTGSSSDALCVMETRETTSVLWIGRKDSTDDLQQTGGRLAVPRLASFYGSLLKKRPDLVPIWND